jgi:SAM-dependent methyltransferase
MQEFWELRYQSSGLIWGTSPSQTAWHALEIFKRRKIQTVLVPGSGYGRNTKVFSDAGMSVTGVEISPAACEMAAQHDPKTQVYQGDAITVIPPGAPFDALYCFNVLHLLNRAGRESLIARCRSMVEAGGILYFTVFSELEPTFGNGFESEPNTFESKPGRPVHYFTENDLRDHFKDFKILETGLVEEDEDHDGAPHTHWLRFLIAKCLPTQ